MSGLISPEARAARTVALAAVESPASAYGIADAVVFALDSAQLLQSPEIAAELARLRARVTELERSAAPAAASQPGEACACAPHRKFECGHCELDVCQDCGRCCSCTCATEGGERP